MGHLSLNSCDSIFINCKQEASLCNWAVAMETHYLYPMERDYSFIPVLIVSYSHCDYTNYCKTSFKCTFFSVFTNSDNVKHLESTLLVSREWLIVSAERRL